jgi:hypothetical protein
VGSRRTVLRELAGGLTNHYFCSPCNALHRIELNDSSSAYIPVAQTLSKTCLHRRKQRNLDDGLFSQRSGYFNHIALSYFQLAIKYARMRDPGCKALLKPLRIIDLGKDKLAYSSTMVSLVIDGRVTTMTRRKIRASSVHFTLSTLVEACYSICPHRHTSWDTNPNGRWQLAVLTSQIFPATRSSN